MDEPLFILGLKSMRERHAPSLGWIDDLEFREIGAAPEPFYIKGVSEAFDCVIFIRRSTPSHLF